jgi:hypothetical protein
LGFRLKKATRSLILKEKSANKNSTLRDLFRGDKEAIALSKVTQDAFLFFVQY